MRKIIGIFRFIYVVIEVLWFCIKGHIAGFFTNKELFYRKRIGREGFRILKNLNATLTIEGLENLEANKTYILMGNHRSYTDILVLFLAMAVAKREVVFMSKKEIFKVPFLGGAMKALGIIGVDRQESSEAFKSLIKAIETVKEGKNLIMFPEGTRSITGELLPLKRGGFVLATRAKMDIAPFIITGTEKFMPKSGFGIYPAHVNIKFLPIIFSDGLRDKQLLEQVEVSLKTALNEV